ncbi:L,D-transpeptidase family protein [Zoogloea sp.]|uniref:L,D-transpeptidase family protein n=1 Tax=Zoogloea sp. TaxID=49181 RepID=UPI00261DEAE8|nr:L,D-transpeptidase family protein [Zoogloea sp.]MDD3353903.1 L,D-transpeptidase family protein [Zoogloea sp.]
MVLLKAVLLRGLAAALACTSLLALGAQSERATPSPDAALASVFRDIEQGRLEQALAGVDALLAAYPNFRLAHLIRGDLLLARTRPLHTFGSLSDAPEEKVADLRDEAMVRLEAYRHRPPENYLPRYLLRMEPSQRYALVVDARRSRLYIYENDEGRPRFVTDYYVTQGKLGAEKMREGDKRTPVGVYHVTAHLARQKLSDFYGSGAFPISYPNEWDRLNGRDGHGIWLHGTPSDTYSRPPRASDGCVVLANRDLEALSPYLQIGVTPVIISNAVEWLSLEDWTAERDNLNRQVENWRKDLESLDVERYLSHYSRSFRSAEGDFAQWARQKRQIASAKTSVKVELNRLSVFRTPGRQDLVVITFEQEYRSNTLSHVLKKRQYWQKEGRRWKIVYEGLA